MLNSGIASLEMLSRFLTIARQEFPDSAIKIFFPSFIFGKISSVQSGITRFSQSCKDSPSGKSFGSTFLYSDKFLGAVGSSGESRGGRIEYDLRQSLTCSAPYFSAISILERPCKAP